MELFVELLLSAITIFTTIYVYFSFAYKYWERRGFPYLEPKFPLGNTTTFLNFSKVLGMETLSFYDEIKKKNLKFAGVYTVTRPLLVVTDADYIRDILAKDFNYFVDRGFFYNEKAEPISAHLFAMDDSQWKNMRVKLTPTFTSGKMKMMFHSVVTHSKTLIQAFDKCAKDNKDLDALDLLANFSTDVIGSCAFGLDMKSFDSNEDQFRKLGRIFSKPEGIIHILKLSIATNIPSLAKFLGLTMGRRDVTRFFSDLVTATVKHREEHKMRRQDFLQLLIDMKNEEQILTMDQIIAQTFLFFVAGFDTSSAAMNFALYELARHPDLQERVREEIDTVLEKSNGEITFDNIQEMTYLLQVIEETLRLYPPVANLQRVCIKEYKLRDSDLILEKGTPVVIPILGLHKDPDHYSDPETFNPERFTKENKEQRHHFAHLPFGEGPRNCIGLRFGLMQSRVGLIQILRNFRITLSPTTKMPLTLNRKVFLIRTNETLYLRAERIRDIE